MYLESGVLFIIVTGGSIQQQQIVIKPFTMVLNGGVESKLQHVVQLQWCVE